MSLPFCKGSRLVVASGFLASLPLLLPAALTAQTSSGTDFVFCGGKGCPGENPKVANITILQQSGARPRWSPDGKHIVFDRPGSDGNYDVYVMDPNGNSVQSITAGNPGITQRNNGNARFSPSGNYIVFLSEVQNHYGGSVSWYGDPGLGLYSNIWATDLTGSQFWQLTNIPIKQTLDDGLPSYGDVNPAFSFDGSQLVWTERYAEGGKWGLWRIQDAPYSESGAGPQVGAENTLFTPNDGTYVTALEFFDSTHVMVAGNLDGQDVYGMDQYALDTQSLNYTNFTNTPLRWEEDDCISPNKQWVVFMSDITSNFPLNFFNLNWPAQPRQREYFLMRTDGTSKEQLTFFNDSSAPEYVNAGQHRVIADACEFAPDGSSLAATIGIDYGTPTTANFTLKVARIDFAQPSLFANPPGTPSVQPGQIVNGGSFKAGFAPGAWISIFGQNLAPDTRGWNGLDFSGSAYAPRNPLNLPTSMDGVSVSVNGQPAYISYISPGQINALAPGASNQGPVQIQVNTSGGASQPAAAMQLAYSPAFFNYSQGGGKYVAAQHANYSPVGNTGLIPGRSTPAKPGETVILYGTGFGPTGLGALIGELIEKALGLNAPVSVTIGGVPATVKYSGLTESGLNQINVTIPSVPDGDQQVIATINGQQTQPNTYITVEE